MKSSKVKHFLTTRDVSRLLGVSTGTVQKMADKKVLESYQTTGGHRRITAASVKRYIENIDPKFFSGLCEEVQPTPSPFDYGDREFIFLVNNARTEVHSNQIHLHKVTFISRPSELFKLFSHRGVVVIDAAIDWVDWVDGLCNLYKAQEDHVSEVLVFNSRLIDEGKIRQIPRDVLLFQQDLAVDFVRGYFSLQNRFNGLGDRLAVN